jgi:hypothetical protein
MVRLNVGGQLFWTTRETLVGRGRVNYFDTLLSSRFPSLRDDDGAYFIDRDGHLFAPLLSYLRTGRLVAPPNVPYKYVLLHVCCRAQTPKSASTH